MKRIGSINIVTTRSATRLSIAGVALAVAGVFIGLALVEYGKVLGIEDLLRKQARQAGAAEPCHACWIETAEGRDASFTYSILGMIFGAFGIAALITAGKSIVKKIR